MNMFIETDRRLEKLNVINHKFVFYTSFNECIGTLSYTNTDVTDFTRAQRS